MMIEWFVFIAILLGVSFFCSGLFMLLGIFRHRTIWHFLGFVILGLLIAVAIDNLVGLFAWLELGMMFTDIGASTFLVGMVFMNSVMLWNFLATDGKQLVR